MNRIVDRAIGPQLGNVIDQRQSRVPTVKHAELHAALHQAIRTATSSRLRMVLTALVDQHPGATDWLSGLMLTTKEGMAVAIGSQGNQAEGNGDSEDEDNTGSEGEDGSGEESAESSAQDEAEHVENTMRGVRPRFIVCKQCKQEFDVLLNGKRACRWHEGDLDVDDDDDFWADHDENCHGTIDTDDMRKDFPEGFTWTCCGEDGSAEGCQRGWHKDKTLRNGMYGTGEDQKRSRDEDCGASVAKKIKLGGYSKKRLWE